MLSNTLQKSSASSTRAVKRTFRPDVQGLRMVAVVAVILDHLIGWPPGGFVGVDVFFVISGFLITGLLLREHDKTGKISFTGFYRRRIKRILPAATLVLVVTVIAAFRLFNSVRAMSTLTDAFWAFFFASNWHFAAAGTDYFQSGGPTSPLQHYWSLSVEEQFYFVWPWLMLLIFWIGGRRAKWDTHVARRVVGIVMALIVIGSFVWSVRETAEAPTLAYFSTISRAWELGLGSLVAVFSNVLVRVPSVLRPTLAWVGLIGIAISLFVINGTLAFPGPWALLPALSTSLVIAAGVGGDSRYLWPITNSVSRWFGDLSYSLYLWHFPVIILLAVVIPNSNAMYYFVAIGLMVALSVVSYYVVENPIRTSSWLSGLSKAEKRELRRRKRAVRQGKSGRSPLYLVGGLLVCSALLVAVALNRPEAGAASGPLYVAGASSVSPGPSSTPSVGEPASTEIQGEITAALAAASWPDNLSPSMDDAIQSSILPTDLAKCAGKGSPSAESCTFGSDSATKTVMVIGDSTAAAYSGVVKNIVDGSSGWRLVTRAMFGCIFADARYSNDDPEVVQECPDRNSSTVDLVNAIHPDLVLITNNYGLHKSADGGATVPASAWQQDLSREVQKIATSAGKIVFLSPPPADVNIQDCYTPVSSPKDCISNVQQAWVDISKAETAIASTVGGVFIDSRQWFCANNRCPSFVGTTPTKIDLTHMTPAYADKITPLVKNELASDGFTF